MRNVAQAGLAVIFSGGSTTNSWAQPPGSSQQFEIGEVHARTHTSSRNMTGGVRNGRLALRDGSMSDPIRFA